MTDPTHDTSSTFPSGGDALWRYVVAFGIIAVGAVVLAVLVEGVVRLLVAGL